MRLSNIYFLSANKGKDYDRALQEICPIACKVLAATGLLSEYHFHGTVY